MRTSLAWVSVCLLMVSGTVSGAGIARAQSRGSMKDDAGEVAVKVLADLDAIVEEAARFPDAASGERIRKIVERARARLAPLAPPPQTAASRPAAGPRTPDGAPAGAPRSTGTGGAMSDKDFKDVMRALKSQSLDGARLSVVQNAIDAGGRFNTAQIGQMVNGFTSEDMRIEAAGRLWARCTESNFAPIYNQIDSEAGKKALRARVEGGSGNAQAAPAGAPKGTMAQPTKPPKLQSTRP